MRRRLTYVLIATVVIALVFVGTSGTAKERFFLSIRPSAASAFSYGMRHLDGKEPGAYNISDAEYFFERAIQLDPAYPQAHQQLARIHFLNGEYERALDEINLEFARDPGTQDSSTFYIRGLIEGYLKQYESAVHDYKRSVQLDPKGWEGRVDYAWVLIKTEQFDEALKVIRDGLVVRPENPWLLSVYATVLFETGDVQAALVAARRAKTAIDGLTEAEWSEAYPGNAPHAAETGLRTLRAAAEINLKKIEAAAQR